MTSLQSKSFLSVVITQAQRETAITAGLNTFTCFPRLPQELQNKIWKIATAFPRLVLYPSTTVWLMHGTFDQRDTPRLRSNNRWVCAPPAVVQVSRNSRREALPFHETWCQSVWEGYLSWEGREGRAHLVDDDLRRSYLTGPALYFRPQHDTLYLHPGLGDFMEHPGWYFPMSRQCLEEGIRSVAIYWNLLENNQGGTSNVKSKIGILIEIWAVMDEVCLVINTDFRGEQMEREVALVEVELEAIPPTAAEIMKNLRDLYKSDRSPGIPWPRTRVVEILELGNDRDIR